MATPTHLLLHRYTPGTGPQAGTEELLAEMETWAQIDRQLRTSGQLVAGWALNDAVQTLGTARDASTAVVFAVHAVSAGSNAEAERIAVSMPHLNYGSTEIRTTMPNPIAE